MTVNEIINRIGRVSWSSVRAWPYNIIALGPCPGGVWVADFRKTDCCLTNSVAQHRVYLQYAQSNTLCQLLLATIDDIIGCGGYWDVDGLIPSRWPDSVWVFLDAVMEFNGDNPLIVAICESILRVRLTIV
jgi:hypothetical protein